MLFEKIKMSIMEAGLNVQNAAENAWIGAKVACSPVKPLDTSSVDSKGCESEKKCEEEYEVEPSGESLFSRMMSGNPGFTIKDKQQKEANKKNDVKDVKSEVKADEKKTETKNDVKDDKSEVKADEKKTETKNDVKDTKSEKKTKTEVKNENKGADRMNWTSNHIKDNASEKINLADIVGNFVKKTDVDMGVQSPVNMYDGFQQFVQPVQMPNYQQPVMNQQPAQMPNYQQPIVNNQPVQMPVYQQPVQQYPYNQPQPNARYMHKVDEPVMQNANPKIVKAKPDDVECNIDLGITVKPEEKNITYKIVDEEAYDQIDTVNEVEKVSKFDNSEVINKYPNLHLDEVEKIALDKGCQVKMTERKSISGMPIGLIDCFTSVDDAYAVKKSFTIDTGNIIDRRAKVFPEIVQYGYEKLQAYPLKVRSNNKEDKKQVFNKEIFENIFVGGIDSLPERGLYSPERRELNQVVDLMSMPTKDMTSDDRKAVMKRLEDAYKSGVFTTSEYYKNTNHAFRFMFKDNSYNKNTKTFTLINTAPLFFNGPYNSASKILINFGVNGKTTVSVMK